MHEEPNKMIAISASPIAIIIAKYAACGTVSTSLLLVTELNVKNTATERIVVIRYGIYIFRLRHMLESAIFGTRSFLLIQTHLLSRLQSL